MRRRSDEWEQSGRSGPTRPPNSVLAGPFYLVASKLFRPVVCLPTELFQDCNLGSWLIQPGGTRSSFLCPTGDGSRPSKECKNG